MSNRLNILLHTVFYHPEVVGVAAYNTAMCEWLAARGHEVHVVCTPPYYPAWKVQRPYRAWSYSQEAINGVQITRCPVWLPRNPRGLGRILYGASFLLSSAPALIAKARRRRPDVVLVTSPSFLNSVAALPSAYLSDALPWLHIQDFEVDIALGTGQVRGGAVASLIRAGEAAVLKRFGIVSTISERMLQWLSEKGVELDKQILFPNWVNTQSIFPSEHGAEFRASLNVGRDDLVCLFSGSLGEKQGVDALIRAAAALAGHPKIKVVICGGGPTLLSLRAQAAEMENVTFLPLQPVEQLNALLNMADIHVLTQRPGVADLVMPSKLLGMLASGRPVIATVNDASQVSAIVSRCGIVVPPGNDRALADAILLLASQPKVREDLGRKARRYAEENCSLNVILSRFEERLTASCATRRGAAKVGAAPAISTNTHSEPHASASNLP